MIGKMQLPDSRESPASPIKTPLAASRHAGQLVNTQPLKIFRLRDYEISKWGDLKPGDRGGGDGVKRKMKVKFQIKDVTGDM